MSRAPNELVIPDLDTGWMVDAACTHRLDLPWTGGPGAAGSGIRRVMRRICAACPVGHECDEFADAADVTAGIWAGLSYDAPHGEGRPHLAARRRRDDVA